MPKSTYGVRVRKSPKSKWQRAKTLTNPKGVWRTKAAAEFVLAKYVKKGWAGHVYRIPAAVKYPTATHYSPHFTRAELECKCGCVTPKHVERNLRKLAVNLEQMRFQLGGTLGVVSGYRCPKRNAEVNGAVDSQHLRGTAADVAVPSGEQDRYVAAAERVPAFRKGGIGVYPNGGVHVDRRGYVARWSSWVGSRR